MLGPGDKEEYMLGREKRITTHQSRERRSTTHWGWEREDEMKVIAREADPAAGT